MHIKITLKCISFPIAMTVNFEKKKHIFILIALSNKKQEKIKHVYIFKEFLKNNCSGHTVNGAIKKN